MSKRLFAVLALLLATLACSWSDVAPPPAPVIEPSPLPTFAISTLTPIPTETALPTLTSTPDAPIAWPKDLGVNCRYGPGKEWGVVSSLPAGTITEIKGRTINTAWWYVSDPMDTDGYCWVAYDVVETAGNLNSVPIVEPPVSSVTAVTVNAVVTFTACGSANQATFKGTITAVGPITATYHWAVNKDASLTTPDKSIQFTESGTKEVTYDSFSADCGSYAVQLLVTAPNTISAEKLFAIKAP